MITVLLFVIFVILLVLFKFEEGRRKGMMEVLDALAEAADKGEHVQIGGVEFYLSRVPPDGRCLIGTTQPHKEALDYE
jgi:hypothetical protein